MTSCREARELMLIAGRDELNCVGDADLPVHLRSCPACAQAAARLQRAEHDLAEALNRLAPVPHVNAVHVNTASAATRIAWSADRQDSRPYRITGREALRIRGRRMAGAVAALAAAAVVLLVLNWPAATNLPRLDPPATMMIAAAETPVVNVTGGGNVAVMQTKDPAITVIWFFNEETR